MKPNFDNCILNVTSAISNRFHLKSSYKPNPQVLEKIKDKKHIFLLILDGLGKNILEQNLDKHSFIRSNLLDTITTVYPPTTVAATTSALSGVAPGETGWIGWHQYFKEIDEDVVLFRNFTFEDKRMLEINVTKTYLNYKPFYQLFKNVQTRELYPAFRKGGFVNFDKMMDEIVRISHQEGETYTYCYWDKPDYLIHEFGTTHELVKENIKMLDENLAKGYEMMGKDSALIMIADHGLIDTIDLYLIDYPDIVACLVRKPTIETRTISFTVNDKVKFSNLFNQYFGKWFKLYDTDTFLKEGFLGQNYQKAIPYLGDFVAIAIDKYCLCYQAGDMKFKANHAGGCDEEMLVPLVVLTK